MYTLSLKRWRARLTQKLNEIIKLCRCNKMAYVSTSWFHFTYANRSIAAVLREREKGNTLRDTRCFCEVFSHTTALVREPDPQQQGKKVTG